jgi:hypothetical protein
MLRKSELSINVWSPVETQTPTHWNLIGRSTTALPSVLSPSNILPPHASLYEFIPASKSSERVSKG